MRGMGRLATAVALMVALGGAAQAVAIDSVTGEAARGTSTPIRPIAPAASPSAPAIGGPGASSCPTWLHPRRAGENRQTVRKEECHERHG